MSRLISRRSTVGTIGESLAGMKSHIKNRESGNHPSSCPHVCTLQSQLAPDVASGVVAGNRPGTGSFLQSSLPVFATDPDSDPIPRQAAFPIPFPSPIKSNQTQTDTSTRLTPASPPPQIAAASLAPSSARRWPPWTRRRAGRPRPC
jgi:hypothetical protein